MAAALPFIAAGSGLLKGVGGMMAGRANARAAEEQAKEEERAALLQREQVRVNARRAIGAQLASMGEGGLEGVGSGGTALDALRESQIEAALDAMEIRRQGVARARSLRRQASNSRREGAFSLVSGILGGATDAIQISSDWAQDRRMEAG